MTVEELIEELKRMPLTAMVDFEDLTGVNEVVLRIYYEHGIVHIVTQ